MTSKYYQEAQYASAMRTEQFRDMIRWAKSPSYFKPMEKGMPKAEIGLCRCGHAGKWYEFIIHNLA